jgi:hypothetical protein
VNGPVNKYSDHIFYFSYGAGIAKGYGLDGRGSIPGKGEIFFIFSTVARRALGPTQPPIQWVKRPGREADHSPPSNAEVKNGGILPPLPHTSS